MPREPPSSRAFRAAQPAGSCSSRPRGAWEAGEGPGFLSADSAGRAPGPHPATRGSGAARPERRCTWSPRRRRSQPAVEARARATGRIPEPVSAAAGWRGARARAGGLVPGLVPRPPAAASVFCFRWVPGAATPISVRGDLREPGGEGRERLCGEPRGGARGAAWPGPRCGTRPSRPSHGRGPGSARWPCAQTRALSSLSGRCQTCLSPESAIPALQIRCPSGTVLESHRCNRSNA